MEANVEARRILKNVVVVSLTFFFLFMSYSCVANIQSSINIRHSLGTIALATIYIGLVLSSLILTPLLIPKIGEKKTMAGCAFSYSFYIAAQYYPSFWTLIPSAFIIGAAAAPIWASKCTYFTHVAGRYAEICAEERQHVLSRFFGWFFMTFNIAGVLGQLITASILQAKSDREDIASTPEALATCGVNFCDQKIEENVNFQRPSDSTLNLITSIAIGICLLATINIIFFLDPPSRFTSEESVSEESPASLWHLIKSAFLQMKEPKQALLLVLVYYSGVEQAYITADFTKAFISCAWGIPYIGFVMITYNATNALMSAFAGHLLKVIGRISLMIIGGVLTLVAISLMMTWTPPTPDESWMFFIIVFLWGIADAIWQTQVNGLIGTIFHQKEQAVGAFASYKIWESLGFLQAYFLSGVLCTHVKLYIMSSILVIGLICYFLVEFLLRRERKGEQTEQILKLRERSQELMTS